jgi:FAD-dependent urate hydroxylase
MNSALAALEAQVCADLAGTAHPDAKWLVSRQALDGGSALDVLVVGAGQSGLATAFGLMRSL